MKMKITPRSTQKMKLSTKLILASVAITVSALVLVITKPAPQSQSASKSASFNSGRCLSFNGTNSEVNFSANDLGLGSGNKMTVTAWIKWSSKSGAGSWANIVTLNRSNGSGDEGQFWLQHNSGNSAFEFAVENTSSRSYTTGTTNPVAGTWYHLAGVYDGSYINIYVNGIREARTAFTGNINNYTGNYKLVFGKWANSGDSYRRFKGDIDEVTIWNKALSQTQIRDMMCSKLNGNESGLLGYWRMNETSGTVVKDFTSNNRNGTSSNTTISMSGAPVGDGSKYTYGGTSLGLSNPLYGDSIDVKNFSSTPAGIHLYRIDTSPNYTTLPSSYRSIAADYYYGVFIINSTGETYRVVYYYNGNPGATSADMLGLLTRINNSVTSWSDLAANLNSSNGFLAKAGQTGRNEYIMAVKGIGTLPIELLDFSAVAKENYVAISWITSSETNNDFFTIERTVDGTNFETIDKIKGAGTRTQQQQYATTDRKPLTGLSYYRLRQTDFDGKTEAFNLVPVEFKNLEEEINFEIAKTYPNPFNDKFIVELNCKNEMSLQLALLSFDGKIVFSETFDCYEGSNALECFPKQQLSDGNYILTVSDQSGNKKSAKLIKKE